MSKRTDNLSNTYTDFKHLFNGFFHSVLWKILIDEVHKNKVIAFYPCIESGFIRLGIIIANEPGYIATLATMDIPYKEASKACVNLSIRLFKYDEIAYDKIISSSMFHK